MHATGHVYPGGLSRGDTPPREIPTTGAAGSRNPSDRRLAEMSAPCPFARDETARFAGRSQGMSLGVIRKEDVPPGPLLYTKDFDRSLTTWDIMENAGSKQAGQYRERPQPQEFDDRFMRWSPGEGQHQLKLRSRRGLEHQDLQDVASTQVVDLLGYVAPPWDPSLLLPSQEQPKGRCTLDVSDIEGTSPAPPIPERRQYGDTMRCEEEFRSKGPMTPEADGLQDLLSQADHQLLPRRETNPVDPRYRVTLTAGLPGTSLHARWSEEKRSLGAAPPPEAVAEIGVVPGSAPRKVPLKEGPFLSLETADVEGARSVVRVGGLPFSIYGPPGIRPLQSSNLNTADIAGAQAGTLLRAPRKMDTPRLAGAAIAAGGTPRHRQRLDG